MHCHSLQSLRINILVDPVQPLPVSSLYVSVDILCHHVQQCELFVGDAAGTMRVHQWT